MKSLIYFILHFSPLLGGDGGGFWFLLYRRHDNLPYLHGMLYAMHLVRGAAAAHQFHTAGADDALPQGLVEVDGLNAS